MHHSIEHTLACMTSIWSICSVPDHNAAVYLSGAMVAEPSLAGLL
jgi:hypothetical protein